MMEELEEMEIKGVWGGAKALAKRALRPPHDKKQPGSKGAARNRPQTATQALPNSLLAQGAWLGSKRGWFMCY